jgi:hypothetical protein
MANRTFIFLFFFLLMAALTSLECIAKQTNSKIFTVLDAKKQPIEKLYLNCRNIVFLSVRQKSLIDFQGLEIQSEDANVLVTYVARERRVEIIPLSDKVVLQIYDRFLKKLIDSVELEVGMMPVPEITIKDNSPKPRKEQLVFLIKLENDKKFTTVAPQDDEILCNSLIYFMNQRGKYVAEKKIFLTKRGKNEYLLYVPIQIGTDYDRVIIFLSDFIRINYKKQKTSFSHDFSETLMLN